MSATDKGHDDVIAVHREDGQIVCERCRVPGTIRGRMRGLLGRSELPSAREEEDR
jgi:hypothetical protein